MAPHLGCPHTSCNWLNFEGWRFPSEFCEWIKKWSYLGSELVYLVDGFCLLVHEQVLLSLSKRCSMSSHATMCWGTHDSLVQHLGVLSSHDHDKSTITSAFHIIIESFRFICTNIKFLEYFFVLWSSKISQDFSLSFDSSLPCFFFFDGIIYRAHQVSISFIFHANFSISTYLVFIQNLWNNFWNLFFFF